MASAHFYTASISALYYRFLPPDAPFSAYLPYIVSPLLPFVESFLFLVSYWPSSSSPPFPLLAPNFPSSFSQSSMYAPFISYHPVATLLPVYEYPFCFVVYLLPYYPPLFPVFAHPSPFSSSFYCSPSCFHLSLSLIISSCSWVASWYSLIPVHCLHAVTQSQSCRRLKMFQ